MKTIRQTIGIRTMLAAVSTTFAAAAALTGCCGIPSSAQEVSDRNRDAQEAAAYNPYATTARAAIDSWRPETPGTVEAYFPEVVKETEVFAIKGADTLRLDRYFIPTAADSLSSPVVVYVFGGGFRFGSRDEQMYTSYFEFLARNGYTVVSTDYRPMLGRISFEKRPSPVEFMDILQGAIDTAVVDLYDATEYIVRQESAWNIDPEKIIISGSSAGAITVLQAEYYRCNGHGLASHLPEGFSYAGVVSFAGAISEKKKLEWQDVPCPIMLFHGNADGIVPFRKAHIPFLGGLWGSESVAQSLDRLDASCWLYEIDNAGHEIASLPMTRNLYDIAGFLSRQVLGARPLSVHTLESFPGAPDVKKNFSVLDYIRNNT